MDAFITANSERWTFCVYPGKTIHVIRAGGSRVNTKDRLNSPTQGKGLLCLQYNGVAAKQKFCNNPLISYFLPLVYPPPTAGKRDMTSSGFSIASGLLWIPLIRNIFTSLGSRSSAFSTACPSMPSYHGMSASFPRPSLSVANNRTSITHTASTDRGVPVFPLSGMHRPSLWLRNITEAFQATC